MQRPKRTAHTRSTKHSPQQGTWSEYGPRSSSYHLHEYEATTTKSNQVWLQQHRQAHKLANNPRYVPHFSPRSQW
uniref:Protein PNS1 n=1 Tax=Rhizophora mucronata TaxID=61149 RepID=A0A2P2QFZ0_RHIMU